MASYRPGGLSDYDFSDEEFSGEEDYTISRNNVRN